MRVKYCIPLVLWHLSPQFIVYNYLDIIWKDKHIKKPNPGCPFGPLKRTWLNLWCSLVFTRQFPNRLLSSRRRSLWFLSACDRCLSELCKCGGAYLGNNDTKLAVIYSPALETPFWLNVIRWRAFGRGFLTTRPRARQRLDVGVCPRGIVGATLPAELNPSEGPRAWVPVTHLPSIPSPPPCLFFLESHNGFTPFINGCPRANNSSPQSFYCRRFALRDVKVKPTSLSFTCHIQPADIYVRGNKREGVRV